MLPQLQQVLVSNKHFHSHMIPQEEGCSLKEEEGGAQGGGGGAGRGASRWGGRWGGGQKDLNGWVPQLLTLQS